MSPGILVTIAGAYQPTIDTRKIESSPLNRYALLLMILAVSISATLPTLQLSRNEYQTSPEIVLSSRATSIAVSLSNNSVTVVAGSAAQVDVRVSLASPRSFRVGLTVQGAPAGSTVSFSPSSAKTPFTSTMTIMASGTSANGRYNLTIVASGGGLTSLSSLSILIVPIVHDLAVIRASAPLTSIVGSIVSVNATIANYGSVPETFKANLYSNDTLVTVGIQSTLAAGSEHAMTLAWNTTGFAAGRYRLVVSVPPVFGESDLNDNTRNAGTVTLEESPSGNPSPPTQVPSNPGTGLGYGRSLAIAVAIGEILLVALVIFQGTLRKTVRRIRNRAIPIR